MIDTHSHILPGLDDGAVNLEQSLAMAREAVEGGVRGIVCTPHLREPGGRVATEAPAAVEALQVALAREGIPLKLHVGFELSFSCVNELGMDELDDYTLGRGSRYLLLEMPHDHWPALGDQTIHRLRVNDWIPVLAHPERNPRLQSAPQLLGSLLALGAVAQGTTASLSGLFGRSVQRALLRQLSRGEIALFASDAHYRRRATWNLAESRSALLRHLPGIDADLLLSRNPAALLAGERIEAAAPVGGRGGGTWLSRLWGSRA